MKEIWHTLEVLKLFGGLALFLYGLSLMSGSMRKAAGASLRPALRAITRNRFFGLFGGAAFTAVIQSSAATTVILMGFLEAGIVSLVAAMGVVLGAGIGATVTGQIIAFQLSDWALAVLAIGFAGQYVTRRSMIRNLSTVVMGLGMLFFGLSLVSQSVQPLQGSAAFESAVEALHNPGLGFLVGLVFSIVVESSNAAIGVLIVLAGQGLIPLESAVPVIVGANLGTCTPALFMSLSMSRTARRLAVFYAAHKLVAAAILLPLAAHVASLAAAISPDTGARAIANVHTFFNAFAALLALPFLTPVARSLERRMADHTPALTELPHVTRKTARALSSEPSLALDKSHDAIARLGDLILSSMYQMEMATRGEAREMISKTRASRDEIKAFRDDIDGFFSEVHAMDLSETEARRVSCQILALNELQHVSAVLKRDVLPLVEKVRDGMAFSDEGRRDIVAYEQLAREILHDAVEAFRNDDETAAERVRVKKAEQKRLESDLRGRHLERVRRQIQASLKSNEVHMDALDGYRQICTYSGRIARVVQQGPCANGDHEVDNHAAYDAAR